MDYTIELEELYKIYLKGEEQASDKLQDDHESLIDAMKRYIRTYDDHAAIKRRITNLECKIDADCGCEEECEEASDD